MNTCRHEWIEITAPAPHMLVFHCAHCGAERRAALTFGAALTELERPVFHNDRTEEVGTRFKNFLPGLNPSPLSSDNVAKLKTLLADLHLDDLLS